MPTITRKAEIAGTTTRSAKSAQQRGIQSFGRISKARSDLQSLGKRKAIGTWNGDSDLGGSSKKRRYDSNVAITAKELSRRDPQSPTKALRGSSGDDLPADGCLLTEKGRPVKQAISRKAVRLPVGPNDTPTKGARSTLEAFTLRSSSPSTRDSSPLPSRTSSLPTSPASTRSCSPIFEREQELPEELGDLVDLHSSFLSALSLHYAHHGCLTPVDLRVLNSGVSAIWRKRRVQIDDIRKILGIANSGQSSRAAPTIGAPSLSLVDYGHGKICLENADGVNNANTHKRPIDEELLHTIFANNLEQQWQDYRASKSTSATADTFITTLPLLSIGTCDSLSKLTPLLAKGQRRLEDLKAGAIRVQKSSSFSDPTTTPDALKSRPKLAASRSDSLLSRIRAKELIQSALPPLPSAAMLVRRSALQRVEEIVPVLELLTAASAMGNKKRFGEHGKPRLQSSIQSFTMPTLVQHLQMSLHNPISKEDAVRCIRLLAEVVPEWIALMELGKCVGITVKNAGAVGREEIRRRVQEKLQAL